MRCIECKVKPFTEIRGLVGARPRPRRGRVVLCHGAFELVHPACLRRLVYAKSCGDIVVASVCCDRYIEKRNITPWPDEATRAMCLACFEMVDLVFVNTRPTPLYVIGALQPEFYACGFRPASEQLAAVTEAVKSYGGKVI